MGCRNREGLSTLDFREGGSKIQTNEHHAAGGANQGARAPAVNAGAAVVGWYIDQNNLNHGFVWYPGDH